MLYKIGDFSKITKASIRTLRYYDSIDLFKPKEIDLFTNYRYYSEEQIEEYKIISYLKECGFSLEGIKTYWNKFDDNIMIRKKEELMSGIENMKEKIRKVDYLRNNIVDKKICFNKKEINKNKAKTLFLER